MQLQRRRVYTYDEQDRESVMNQSNETNFVSEKGFSAAQMMSEAEYYACKKVGKTTQATISLAILGGAFIGLAFLFFITVTTGNNGVGWGINRLIGGLAFSMGLILIVVFEAELFTSTVLSSIAWANKKVSFKKMITTWTKVYLGNFLGAIIIVALVYAAGLYKLNDGQWGVNALNIAQHKLHHTWTEAFSLGILCNILVCTAIWLTFCSKNPLTKAALIMMPVALFVSSGFEHSIANMFMVPLGFVIAHFSPVEFWAQMGINASDYSEINLSNFIFNNLIPVTIGNIVGGAAFVGLANWAIYRRQLNPEQETRNTQTVSKKHSKLQSVL